MGQNNRTFTFAKVKVATRVNFIYYATYKLQFNDYNSLNFYKLSSKIGFELRLKMKKALIEHFCCIKALLFICVCWPILIHCANGLFFCTPCCELSTDSLYTHNSILQK